jgi:redox-sensitive bicupin YhaK (pirin superfamily)
MVLINKNYSLIFNVGTLTVLFSKKAFMDTKNKTKQIERILVPPAPHMVGDGFRVCNFFPGGYNLKQRVSPFFLLDYNPPHYFPPASRPRGVGVHPHRGFETVTLVFQGAVAHHDSAGHAGVIGPGEVQWMTAGSGVLHKEYHERSFAEQGGIFHVAQLWVNLPAKYKMSPPRYQSITREKQGKYVLDAQGSAVYVIAGNYKGAKGAAHTFTPIELWNIELLTEGTALDISLPADYNTLLLVIEGEVLVNEHKVPAHTLALMDNEGEHFEVRAKTPVAKAVLMSGAPIHEPIAHYGPFLMNSFEEIKQAIEDFNAGKFGYLED